MQNEGTYLQLDEELGGDLINGVENGVDDRSAGFELGRK